MAISDTSGLGLARKITSIVVWIGIVFQVLITLAIFFGLKGIFFRLRKGVDRTIIWYMFGASIGWILQDLNNLAINVHQPFYFGMDCSTTSRFTSISSMIGCMFTYAFLLRKSQNLDAKHSVSKFVYFSIYAMIGMFILVSIVFSVVAFRSEVVIHGHILCIYQGENNGFAVLAVSGLMGILNYGAEFACLYVFLAPLRKLEADIKSLPTSEGFHVHQLRKVMRKNVQATMINILGSGMCAVAVAITVFFSPRASDQVYAVISYVSYGILSSGGLSFCTMDAWAKADQVSDEPHKRAANLVNAPRGSKGDVGGDIVLDKKSSDPDATETELMPTAQKVASTEITDV